MTPDRPILIAGPTASGKSALAMKIAADRGGWIFNADALQIYGCWRVLTARPSVDDEARIPHRLYGFLEAETPYSVGRWLTDLQAGLDEAKAAGARPVIVGGTGLYFRALTQGLAEIPPIPDSVVREGETLLAAEGAEGLAEDLRHIDPKGHAAIDARNPARVMRAWQVYRATGISLADWRDRTPPPLAPLDNCETHLVTPDREVLYARCDARAQSMIAAGALDEAAAIAASGLPDDAPAMKAIGAHDLVAHIRGEISLKEATTNLAQATRRYAKRQLTWFRNQTSGWNPAPGLGD